MSAEKRTSARPGGTAGAGEEVISDELRDSIIREHELSGASEEGFHLDPARCGKVGRCRLTLGSHN